MDGQPSQVSCASLFGSLSLTESGKNPTLLFARLGAAGSGSIVIHGAAIQKGRKKMGEVGGGGGVRKQRTHYRKLRPLCTTERQRNGIAMPPPRSSNSPHTNKKKKEKIVMMIDGRTTSRVSCASGLWESGSGKNLTLSCARLEAEGEKRRG